MILEFERELELEVVVVGAAAVQPAEGEKEVEPGVLQEETGPGAEVPLAPAEAGGAVEQ